MKIGIVPCRLLVLAALIGISNSSLQAVAQSPKPAPAEAQAAISEFESQRQKLFSDMSVGNAEQCRSAIQRISGWCEQVPFGRNRGEMVGLIISAKRYTEADSLAQELMLRSPANTPTMQRMQEARCRAFLAQRNQSKALSCALSYYNVCELKETAQAINLICQCLDVIDPSKAQSAAFKRQQLESSAKPPAREAPTTAPAAILSVDLNEPFLQQASDALQPTSVKQSMAKGNLCLALGRGEEAKSAFEGAQAMAVDDKATAAAIEGVARSLRAIHRSVGPANEYLAAQP